MLLGTMIDNLVVGGPAYNSRQLHHGDIILQVDGIPVTQTNIHDVMVGKDMPGSPVVLSVARGGAKVRLVGYSCAPCSTLGFCRRAR